MILYQLAYFVRCLLIIIINGNTAHFSPYLPAYLSRTNLLCAAHSCRINTDFSHRLFTQEMTNIYRLRHSLIKFI